MQVSHQDLALLLYGFDGEMEWFRVFDNGI